LHLTTQVADNTSYLGTAFTVSIDARRGITTGISAADRATTILVAVDPKSRPQDLAVPVTFSRCAQRTAAFSFVPDKPKRVSTSRASPVFIPPA
jgi:3,4-dihydroxy-2-butanone 4-phosphate synthase